MVPKNLTNEQKVSWRDVCLDLLDRLEREPEFFSRVITGDESCILEYDPYTKRQIGSGTLQTLPVPREREWGNLKSNRCSFVFFLFDSQGIVHKEFVPPGQIVNQNFIGKSLKDSCKSWHVCDQALHALGCFTTTTPHVTRQSPSMNFWLEKAFLWFLSPAVPRISVSVTSFYSLGSKTTWKGVILYFG